MFGIYFTKSVYSVVLQKPIPAQIRHLVLYVINVKAKVDGFAQIDLCRMTI